MLQVLESRGKKKEARGGGGGGVVPLMLARGKKNLLFRSFKIRKRFSRLSGFLVAADASAAIMEEAAALPPLPPQQEENSCDGCERIFGNRGALTRHKNSGNCLKRPMACKYCGQQFRRLDNLKRHETNRHENVIRDVFVCGICPLVFESKATVEAHRATAHTHHHDFRLVESAHKRQTQLLRAFIPSQQGGSADLGFLYSFRHLTSLVRQMKTEFNYFKLNATIHIELGRYNEEGELTELRVFPFRSYSLCVPRLISDEEIKEELARMVGDFERALGEFLNCGSGWTVSRCLFLDAEVNQCHPLAGSSVCNLHIAKYNAKDSTVSPENFTNDPKNPFGVYPPVSCFYAAVAAAFLQPHHWCQPGYLTDYARRHFRFATNPADSVNVQDIHKFERLNDSIDFAITVLYRDEDGEVIPIKTGFTKERSHIKQITLLLFFLKKEMDPQGGGGGGGGGEGGREKGWESHLHYAYVAEPGKILARRTRQVTGKLQTCAVFLCHNCCTIQVRHYSLLFILLLFKFPYFFS